MKHRNKWDRSLKKFALAISIVAILMSACIIIMQSQDEVDGGTDSLYISESFLLLTTTDEGKVFTITSSGLKWYSSNEYVVKVDDEKGILTPVSSGVASIQVRDDKGNWTCRPIYVTNDSITISNGGSFGKTINDNVSYLTIDDEKGIKTLIIVGTGEMRDFPSYGDNKLWDSYKSKITAVKICGEISSIGDCVFCGMSAIKTLYIENNDSLNRIGIKSFTGCTTLDTYIADGVTYASEIHLGKKIKSIDGTSFSNTAFSTITVDGDNDQYVVNKANGVLYNNDYSKLIYCPTLNKNEINNSWFVIDGKPVTWICDHAFRNCNNIAPSDKTIVLPSVMEYVGDCAFQRTQTGYLNKITIEQVTVTNGPNGCNIGPSAFYNTNVKKVIITDTVEKIPKQLFFNSKINELEINKNCSFTTIGNQAFQNMELSNETTITLPDNLTSIGDNAFNGDKNAKFTSLPSSLITIGLGAFRSCTIDNLTIPNKVTVLDTTFQYCKINGKIVVPSSISEYKSNVFGGTKGDAIIINSNADFPYGNLIFADSEVKQIAINSNPKVGAANIFRGYEGAIYCPKSIAEKLDAECTYAILQGGILSENTSFTNQTLCTDLTRDGYTFYEWNTNSDGTGTRVTDYTAEHEGKVVVYAIWKQNYSVTLDKNYPGSSSSTITVAYDFDYSSLGEDPTRVGYVFDSWYTEATGGTKIEKTDTVKITNDETFYAHWTPITYSISFNGNGGQGSMTNQSMTYDVSKNLPQVTFTRTGYDFDSWNTASDGKGTKYADKASVINLSNDNSHPITLYAQWTPITYSISFNGNGGEGSMVNQSMTYDVSKNLPQVTFTRTGYDFDSWNTASDGKGTKYADGAAVNNLCSINTTFTLYAQWTVQTYTITFVEANKTTEQRYNYGTTVSAPTPDTVTGLSFDGWDKTVPTTASESLTITALYKISASDDAVIKNDNGKILASTSGNNITIPQSVLTGKNIKMTISGVTVMMPTIVTFTMNDNLKIGADNNTSSLPASIKNKTNGDATAYDLTAMLGTSSYRNFGSNITVTIPYEGANGNTMVFYLNPNGTVEKMTVTGYTNDSVTFVTSHFSTYVATGVDLSIPDPVPPSSSDDDSSYQQWLQQYYQQIAEQQKQQQALKEQQEQKKIVSVAIAGIAVVMLSIAALMVTRRK